MSWASGRRALKENNVGRPGRNRIRIAWALACDLSLSHHLTRAWIGVCFLLSRGLAAGRDLTSTNLSQNPTRRAAWDCQSKVTTSSGIHKKLTLLCQSTAEPPLLHFSIRDNQDYVNYSERIHSSPTLVDCNLVGKRLCRSDGRLPPPLQKPGRRAGSFTSSLAILASAEPVCGGAGGSGQCLARPPLGF